MSPGAKLVVAVGDRWAPRQVELEANAQRDFTRLYFLSGVRRSPAPPSPRTFRVAPRTRNQSPHPPPSVDQSRRSRWSPPRNPLGRNSLPFRPSRTISSAAFSKSRPNSIPIQPSPTFSTTPPATSAPPPSKPPCWPSSTLPTPTAIAAPSSRSSPLTCPPPLRLSALVRRRQNQAAPRNPRHPSSQPGSIPNRQHDPLRWRSPSPPLHRP